MSDPLDDFNRRLTRGDMDGPPTNAAESAAQTFLEGRRSPPGAVGGGSIDFGGRIGTILIGIAGLLLLGGGWLVENSQEGKALAGILLLLLGAMLMLVGTGALLVASIRKAASAPLAVALALVSAAIATWSTPRIALQLWLMGVPVPRWSHWVIALVTAAIAFVILQRLWRAIAGRKTSR